MYKPLVRLHILIVVLYCVEFYKGHVTLMTIINDIILQANTYLHLFILKSLRVTCVHLRNVNGDDVIRRHQGRSTRQRQPVVTRKWLAG